MSLNKGILTNFITRFGAALSNLFISVAISQYLGAEIKGEHALFIAGVAMLQLLGSWFGSASLVYLAPRHSSIKLGIISFAWAVISMLPVWIVLDYFRLIPEAGSIQLLFASLLFGFWSNLGNILLGKEQTGKFNWLQALPPLITLAFLLFSFEFIEVNFLSFVYSYLAAQFLNVLLALYFMRGLWQDEKKDTYSGLIKVLYRHGFFIQLANLTQFFNYRLLYFFIDSYFGKSFLGIYSNAQSLAESIWMVTRSISTVQFARIANSNNDAENKKLTRKYGLISLVLSFLGVFVLVLLPEQFFVRLFGDEFSTIGNILYLISPAILAMSMGNIYAHYFAGSGRNSVNFIGSLINLICMLTAFFLLKEQFGKYAAPIASSLAFAAHAAYHLLYFRFDRKNQPSLSKQESV